MTTMLHVPHRPGPKPRTTQTNPHQQLDQRPPAELIELMTQRCFAFAQVVERPSLISVKGARALYLKPGVLSGPRAAFLIEREFAHIHPLPDGSMHLALPAETAREVIDKGWGEPHPVARMGLIPAGIIMVYAPRDANELAVVMHIVEASHRFALGQIELPA